jgi:emfourin
VRIKVERSGGFAGIPISNVMDEKDLPSALIRTAKKIMENTKSSSLPLKSTPKGAADHYSFKISVQDGRNLREIECNEFNIDDDLKSLVKYIQSNSKKMN